MKKILVVEDNELNMKLFVDILEYQKYEVFKSYDGLEAYNLIRTNSYDLIILDLKLPNLDGFQILDKLKKDKIKLPNIIMASACAMDSDKSKAKEYGINDYITKPIDINNFIKIVKSKLN